jgi:hypothetical protein
MEQAFVTKIKQAPYAFNYATFIINRILRFNGVLIDRPTAAAILGICDLEAAERILSKLARQGRHLQYEGVFAVANERFWRDELLNTLNALADNGRWLHLSAADRVGILKKKLRLTRLKPAEPIHKTYQTDFDCVCAYSRVPLARRNGYRLRATVLDPWIEPRFIAGTVYRSLPQTKAKLVPLDVGEQERFEADFNKN